MPPPRARAAKQVLPPNAPADRTRDLPLAYTAFHAPSFVNAKSRSRPLTQTSRRPT